MHKKQRIIWWLITIWIECIIATVCWFLFFSHYKELTTTEWTVQAYTTKLDMKIDFSKIDNQKTPNKNSESFGKKPTDWTSSYDWVFGQIVIVQKNTKKNIFDSTKKQTSIIKLNKEKIYIYHIILKRLEDWIIDNKLADYILESKNPQQIIQDTIFLSAYSQYLITDKDIPSKNIITTYANLIQNWYHEELITTLKNLETMINFQLKKTPKKMFLSQPRMSTESRTYIQNKFVFDDKNQYRANIDLVANMLNVDKNLLKSAIIWEQVRGFFTYRWVAKKIITDNFGVMRMGQGSYGVGGVKLETAKNILQRAKKHQKKTFSKHLNRNRTDDELKTVLQDREDSFYQILFAWLTLKEILSTRETSWNSIENQPWILLTLYNIWNKTPHPNPEIGWATIDINWQQWSFGSLGMLMYYYLESY